MGCPGLQQDLRLEEPGHHRHLDPWIAVVGDTHSWTKNPPCLIVGRVDGMASIAESCCSVNLIHMWSAKIFVCFFD